MNTTTTRLTKADFASSQEVRWCPGCGDYAILASVQKVLPELGIPRENMVFISGIGCSGRFPYYLNTYGFHTIHGRAPAVATGLKLTRPELMVWVVTGDGDALSIGGNHLIHALRRNLDIKILLFNNRIYGLTKGQYSPTSEQGKVTGTSPQGSIEQPLDPIKIALAAGASFVARALDIDAKGLQTVLKAAAAHKGSALVEIYQNCNIFNDGAFSAFSDKSVRADKTLWLESGQPMLFGANRDQGIRLANWQPETMALNPHNQADVLVHDAQQLGLAQLLTGLQYPDFPVPLGIFYQVSRPTYEQQMQAQMDNQIANLGVGHLEQLLNSGQTWDVS